MTERPADCTSGSGICQGTLGQGCLMRAETRPGLRTDLAAPLSVLDVLSLQSPVPCELSPFGSPGTRLAGPQGSDISRPAGCLPPRPPPVPAPAKLKAARRPLPARSFSRSSSLNDKKVDLPGYQPHTAAGGTQCPSSCLTTSLRCRSC